MSATSCTSGRNSLTPSKSLFRVSSERLANNLWVIPILLKSAPNFSRHSRSYCSRNFHRSSRGALAAFDAACPASIPEYPPMIMPPPVVCLTWLAASPTTRKFSDQHLSIGPETSTEPDFVPSMVDFGQHSLTRSSSSFFTLPFPEANPTLELWSPVGMLHAKNPGAR